MSNTYPAPAVNVATPEPGTLLAFVEELAASHGWTLAKVTESEGHPNGRRTYVRNGERVDMSTWPGTGGVPSLSATLAAGRVITRRFGRGWTGHNVPAAVVIEAFTGPRAETFPASPYVIVVDAGEFVDRTAYETASNYNTVATVPGRYPVELLDDSGRVVASVDKARQFVAIVPATIVGEYYVNRLGSASSAHDNAVSRPTVHHVTGHPRHFADGSAPVFLDGLATIVPAV